MRQIGNAVPPLLARVVLGRLRDPLTAFDVGVAPYGEAFTTVFHTGRNLWMRSRSPSDIQTGSVVR